MKTDTRLRLVAPLVLALLFALGSTALANPSVIRFGFNEPARAHMGDVAIVFARFGSGAVSVTFAGEGGERIPASPLLADPGRGVLVVRVPVGAVSGGFEIDDGSGASAPYEVAIEPGLVDSGIEWVYGRIMSGQYGVSGAEVVLLRRDGCGDLVAWDATVTDIDGYYYLLCEPGEHTLVVLPPRESGLASMRIPLYVPEMSEVPDLFLVPGAPVTGRIVAEGGSTPVAGAFVEFEAASGFEMAFTEPDGTFSVTLASDVWGVAATPPAGMRAGRGQSSLEVGEAPLAAGDIALAEGPVRVSGLVRDMYDQRALAGAGVQAMQVEPCCTILAQGQTGGDGRYEVLVPQDVQVELSVVFDRGASHVDVVTGLTIEQADLEQDIDVDRAVTIEGRLTSQATSEPVQESVSAIVIADGASAGVSSSCEDGTYRLRLKADASGYRLVAAAGSLDRAAAAWNGTTHGTPYVCEATGLASGAPGDAETAIDLELGASATILGRVATAVSSCTEGLGGPFSVTVDDGQPHACGMGWTDFGGGPGAYAVRGLPVTAHALRACFAAEGVSGQCWSMRAVGHGYTPLLLPPSGVAEGIDFCAGSTPSAEIATLTVEKQGASLRLQWSASTDLFHEMYVVRGATNVRPAHGRGTFPSDPFFGVVAQTSAPEVTLDIAGAPGFFLVVDSGADGSEGTCGAYDQAVLP